MSQPKKTLKQRFAAMFGKRFRAGGYSAAASAIVIAIAVLVNLMVGSLPTTLTQIDLTDQSIYSLSDQTKRIAASLDKDVTMYLICNTGNEDHRAAAVAPLCRPERPYSGGGNGPLLASHVPG